MFRKDHIQILLALVVSASLLLVSCGAPAAEEPVAEEAEEPAAVEEEAEEPAAEEITLKIWTWTWEPENLYVESIIEEFEAENPNINILYEHFPASGENSFSDQLLISFAAGDPPDVFFIRESETPAYVDKGLIQPIDDVAIESMGYPSMDAFLDRYLTGALDGWAWDGVHYGVTNELILYMLFANTEYLQEAGYDPDTVKLETWEDVVDVAKDTIVQDADGKFTRVGFRMGMTSSRYVGHHVQLFLFQFGGSILNEEGTQCTLNEPEGVKAMEYMQWLLRDSGVSDPHFGTQEGGAFQADWGAGLSTFIAVNASAARHGGPDSAIAGKWRTYPLPYPEEGIQSNINAGWGWVVPKDTKYPEEAWQLIGALTADPTRALLASGLPEGVKGLITDEVIAAHPEYAAYEPSAPGMVWELRHLNSQEILDIVVPLAQSLVYEGIDVQAALDQACEEINAAIQSE